MNAHQGSVQTETPSRTAGRPIVDQHLAGEYPGGRALLQQRFGGGWYMRR